MKREFDKFELDDQIKYHESHSKTDSSRSKMKILNSKIMYIYLIIDWNLKVNFNEVSFIDICFIFYFKISKFLIFSSKISRENKNSTIFIFE
jgi:hypothetical protein